MTINNRDGDAQTTTCELRGEGSQAMGRPTGTLGGGRIQTLSLMGITSGPGIVTIYCTGHNTIATNADLVSIEVTERPAQG